MELVGHQQHGQVLVDAAQPTAVYLDKLQRRGLEELLKHHPVVTLQRKQLPHQKLEILEIPSIDVCTWANLSSDLLPRCHSNPEWSQSLKQQSQTSFIRPQPLMDSCHWA